MRASTAALSVALVLSGNAGALGQHLAIPKFVDETEIAGIASIYEGDWEYMVGGGVAVFDCNSDGFADMLLAGGTAPAKLYRNLSQQGGSLKFETFESGLEIDKVAGTYPLDIDSDGKVDIVLLRVGENIVMRGLGECRFERANEAWGFDGGDAWSAAFAATWERGANWPTIAIGNYIDREEEAFPWGSCTDNWLHRPGEPGRFAPPLALAPSHCTLSMLFTDWDRSGIPALRVSNDREYYKGGQEQLWRIEPGKPPELFTEAEGWKPLRIWGMGIAGYDVDLDGYPEYFHTSMADNKLQKLARFSAGARPKPVYEDIAWARGVTAHRPFMGEDLKPSTAWHTQFADFNNDARVDLFIAKGNVAKMPDFAARDPNNLLLQRFDGKFFEAADRAGVASGAISRGGAVADFNVDGLLDLVAVNRWEKAQLWRNVSKDAGRFLSVSLAQEGTNRDAIGAWIEVRRGSSVQRREVFSGGGHASGQNGWWHFGLGNFARADVRVTWPDGTAGDWQSLEAGRFHVLERDKPSRLWTPPAR